MTISIQIDHVPKCLQTKWMGGDIKQHLSSAESNWHSNPNKRNSSLAYLPTWPQMMMMMMRQRGGHILSLWSIQPMAISAFCKVIITTRDWLPMSNISCLNANILHLHRIITSFHPRVPESVAASLLLDGMIYFYATFTMSQVRVMVMVGEELAQ